MQMQIEMHIWLASDVLGIEEMRAFCQKNADRMPWAALSQGNPGMADIQRKLAAMYGIPILTTIKMKNADDRQQAATDQKIAQARAQIEAMKKQGGPQAAMADQILARMGVASSASNITNESSGFSASPIPDSVFAIPADYQKVDK